MSRYMLINGHHAEELRVAIVNDGQLEHFEIDVAQSGLQRGNIYRGVVANIKPGLDAAFVDIGLPKHGFLAAHDVIPPVYHLTPTEIDRPPTIDEVLEKGAPLIVQVTRDSVGGKGAALTTNVSLPGRYLVLQPYDRSRGLSRKIEGEAERKKLKQRIASLHVPDNFGFIVRTKAVGQTLEALRKDLSRLVRLWKKISAAGRKRGGPALLYNDQDLLIQALRDYLDSSITEVLVDDEVLLRRAQEYIKATMPRTKVKLTHYTDRVPLLTKFDLEPQIESVYQREVRLPSGGYIVIDRTEALTAVDVNSGRSTSAASQEETALNTNIEASVETARQLRLRDIGGLIVVDFIDMRLAKHQRKVERALRDAMKIDKARHTIGRISPNGLLEINRQRTKRALWDRTLRPCPTCHGSGLLASPESVGLRLLRRIEARAAAGNLKKVRVALHPELADVIQNQRRRQLVDLETSMDVEIEILASSRLHRADEEIEWILCDAETLRQRAQRRAQEKQGEEPAPAPAPAPTALVSAADIETVEDVEGDDDVVVLREVESGEQNGEGRRSRSGRSRSRSRRRGRRSRSGDKDKKAESPAAKEAAGPATQQSASGEGAQSGADESSGEKKKRRRRRRGGRRRTAGEAPAEAAEAGAASPSASEAAPQAPGPAPSPQASPAPTAAAPAAVAGDA